MMVKKKILLIVLWKKDCVRWVRNYSKRGPVMIKELKPCGFSIVGKNKLCEHCAKYVIEAIEQVRNPRSISVATIMKAIKEKKVGRSIRVQTTWDEIEEILKEHLEGITS